MIARRILPTLTFLMIAGEFDAPRFGALGIARL
jgi:hypothetical protein